MGCLRLRRVVVSQEGALKHSPGPASSTRTAEFEQLSLALVADGGTRRYSGWCSFNCGRSRKNLAPSLVGRCSSPVAANRPSISECRIACSHDARQKQRTEPPAHWSMRGRGPGTRRPLRGFSNSRRCTLVIPSCSKVEPKRATAYRIAMLLRFTISARQPSGKMEKQQEKSVKYDAVQTRSMFSEKTLEMLADDCLGRTRNFFQDDLQLLYTSSRDPWPL